MPIKLSEMRNNERKLRIQYEGLGDLNVVVRPHRFNARLQDRYEVAAANEDYETMADAMNDLVVSWDLLDDDGDPLPIDGETLQTVGLAVFGEIFTRIGELLAPKSGRTKRR